MLYAEVQPIIAVDFSKIDCKGTTFSDIPQVFLEKFASVTKKRGLGLNTFLAFKAVLAVGTVWCRWSL